MQDEVIGVGDSRQEDVDEIHGVGDEGVVMNYRVTVSYGGSITVFVDAKNEKEAQEMGECMINELDDANFLHALDPQHLETIVERGGR